MVNQTNTFVFFFLVGFLFSACSNRGMKRIPELKKDLSGTSIHTAYGDCIVLNDEIDPLTGNRKTDLSPQQIFSHTPDKLRDYFSTSPFIICNGFLSRINTDRYLLNLTFIVNNKNIKVSYNGLSDESLLRIDLINGEKLFLNNIIDDTGKKDNQGRTVFNAIFPLSKNDLKLLKKVELDMFGLIWEGGFENYSVHEIDFLMKQIHCFENIRSSK